MSRYGRRLVRSVSNPRDRAKPILRRVMCDASKMSEEPTIVAGQSHVARLERPLIRGDRAVEARRRETAHGSNLVIKCREKCRIMSHYVAFESGARPSMAFGVPTNPRAIA